MDSSGKILVADDDLDSAEILQQYLGFSGYEVFLAEDGQEAFDRAHTLNPGSIILDVALPKLNGFQVAEKLRQEKRFDKTPIIAYSGYGGADYYEKALKSGMDYYVLKPADPDALLACLEPEKFPHIVAETFVIATKVSDLRTRSFALYSKAQALSIRSAELVNQAQALIRQTQETARQVRETSQRLRRLTDLE